MQLADELDDPLDPEDDECDSAGTPSLPLPLPLPLLLPLLVLWYSYRPGDERDGAGKGYLKRVMSVSRAKGVPTMVAEGEWRMRFARPGIGIDVVMGASGGGDEEGA